MMKRGKKERKQRIVERLEALLNADNETLIAHAHKLVNEDHVQIDGRVNPLVWVRARIKAGIAAAKS